MSQFGRPRHRHIRAMSRQSSSEVDPDLVRSERGSSRAISVDPAGTDGMGGIASIHHLHELQIAREIFRGLPPLDRDDLERVRRRIDEGCNQTPDVVERIARLVIGDLLDGGLGPDELPGRN